MSYLLLATANELLNNLNKSAGMKCLHTAVFVLLVCETNTQTNHVFPRGWFKGRQSVKNKGKCQRNCIDLPRIGSSISLKIQ